MLMLVLSLFIGKLPSQDIRHVTDQFAGSEVWLTKPVGLAKLEQNHCDFWMAFGIEHIKQAGTEFVLVNYLSVQKPFSSAKPMGIVAEVTLKLAVGDTMVSGEPFHPVTADKALVVKGYESKKTDLTPIAGDVEQSFLYALPAGTLKRLGGSAPTKVRLQGPQRTCDAALDERAQSAIGALLTAEGSATRAP
ncbi:MAG: hypothetical protein DMG76_37560 [Acidobacteria bacterium]|nr:MAG: hypothetical protein DMG76_37560 [Acidobacteriota bacterium]